MSWRRLRAILGHLPPESAYRTSVWNAMDGTEQLPPPDPGIFGPWSQTDLLLARVGDRIESLIYMQADPATRGAPPTPYPRPGMESKVWSMSEEDFGYLEYLREHQGEEPPPGMFPSIN